MDTVSKIRTLLKQKGIAGYRMCSDIGLSNATFSQWNTGKTKPTEKNLRKVADHFNVPYETLLPDDE